MRTTLKRLAVPAALITTAAIAPPASAETFGASFVNTPNINCQSPCIVHTKRFANGFMASGSPLPGVLTKVQIKHQGDGGSGAIVVLKHVGASGFRHRSATPVNLIAHTYATPQTFLVRQPVDSGDRVGLLVESNLTDDKLMSNGDPQSTCYVAAPHTPNSVATYGSCGGEPLIQATVEPDLDNDGYGDETQDLEVANPGTPQQPLPTQPVQAPEEQPGPTQQPDPPANTPAIPPNPACAVDKFGTKRRDLLTGTTAGDRLHAYGGPDLLDGKGGDDCLFGGDGDDRLVGGDGHDRVHGGKGNDRVIGGRGDDKLFGDSGRDVLHGGYGDDTITAVGNRRDRDRVYCGPGNDFAHVDRGDKVAGCERVKRFKG